MNPSTTQQAIPFIRSRRFVFLALAVVPLAGQQVVGQFKLETDGHAPASQASRPPAARPGLAAPSVAVAANGHRLN